MSSYLNLLISSACLLWQSCLYLLLHACLLLWFTCCINVRANKLTKCNSIVHNPQCFKLKLSAVDRRVIGAELCPAGTFFTTPSVVPDTRDGNAHFAHFSFRGSSLFFPLKMFFLHILSWDCCQWHMECNIQTRAQKWNACYKPEQYKIFKEWIHAYLGQVKRGIPAVTSFFSDLNSLLLLSNYLPGMSSSFSSFQLKSWWPGIWSLESFPYAQPPSHVNPLSNSLRKQP